MDILAAIEKYLLDGEHPMELIKLVATALTAYFTVKFSMRKFLKEKRWERKSEAYSKIIEALHHLKKCSAIFLDQALEEEHSHTSANDKDEESKMLVKRNQEARAELEKFLDMGRFYISNEAIAVLAKLKEIREECVSDWEHGAMSSDVYHVEFKAVSECLDKITAIAIKETH